MELKATVSVSTPCNVVSLSATLLIYNNNLVFSNFKNKILKIDPTFRGLSTEVMSKISIESSVNDNSDYIQQISSFSRKTKLKNNTRQHLVVQNQSYHLWINVFFFENKFFMLITLDFFFFQYF